MSYEHRARSIVVALSLGVLVGACSQSDETGMGVAADTGSVASGSFNLRYQIEGSGTPTIVIGSSWYYPRAFSENLRSHLRMVFVDHRGFAPSPGPVDTTAFALDTILDDVELIRRELGLGRVIVVGHSGHSFMALEYGKKYPDNVSHVVMIGTAPDYGMENTRLRDQYWEDFASAERKAAWEEALERLPDAELAEMSPGDAMIQGYIRDAPKIWYDPHFDCSPLWESVEINMDMMNHVWGRTFAEIDITQGLDTFDLPVFLALGRYDFLVAPPSSWDGISSAFKDLTVHVFDESGHTPQYEEAALFDQELLAWMSR
jgi:proline iminopeptidase